MPASALLPELLEQADWVRRLAARLVRDPNVADDVAQAAWMQALENPPAEVRNPKAWWSAVVRNVVKNRARSEGRRRRREETGARREATGSTLDLVARADLQRELVEMVLSLDEPYRSTVLLAHFEGFTPRQIAARENVPIGTVQTRLSRAHRKLRERLDANHGDRAAWCVAWVPLLQDAKKASSTLWLAPLAAAALIAGALLWPPGEEPAPVERELAQGMGAAELIRPESSGGERVESDSTRTQNQVHREPHGTTPQGRMQPVEGGVEAPNRYPFRAHVFDLEGRSLSGFPILVAGEEVVSDGSGRIEIEALSRHPKLDTAKTGWGLVLAQKLVDTDGWAILVGKTRVVSGTVIDATMSPVRDLTVTFRAGEPTSFPFVLDGVGNDRVLRPSDVTDSSGRFEFPDVVDVAGSQIGTFFDEDYESITVGSGDQRELVWTIERSGGVRVQGQVLDLAGAPVENAVVSLLYESTRTDEHGRYSMLIRHLEDEVAPLYALVNDQVIGRVDRATDRLLAAPREVHEINVIVHPVGRLRFVIHARPGMPIEGIRGTLIDPTVVPSGNPPEEFNAWNLKAYNLFDRPYSVRFWSPGGLAFEAGPFVPSTEEEPLPTLVTVPEDAFLTDVSGIVLDATDAPVANVEVKLSILTHSQETMKSWQPTDVSAMTDGRGRFHFDRIPRVGGYLSVVAPEIRSKMAGVEEPVTDLIEVRVERLARCQFEDGTLGLSSVNFYDSEGKNLPCRIGNTTTWGGRWTYPMNAIFTVPVHASRMKVTHKDGHEETFELDLYTEIINVLQH